MNRRKFLLNFLLNFLLWILSFIFGYRVGNSNIKSEGALSEELAQNTQRITDIFSNVKSFGAVGDGIADDLQAFKDCHDSLPSTGGTIYIPDGTYLIGNSWMITKDNITVICSSKAVINLAERESSSKAGSAIGFTGGQIGDTNPNSPHINNCTWIGGTINTPRPVDGTPNNENALGFLRANNIKVRDLTVNECGRKAVTAQYNCNVVDISDIKVGSVNWAGVTVESGSKNIKIKNVSIEYTAKYAVAVNSGSTEERQTGIKVENIVCKYAKDRAIVLEYFIDAKLQNIDIQKGDWYGVNAKHGDELLLNDIKLNQVAHNNLLINNIEKTIKVYDINSFNPCLGTTNVDCFYFQDNNATIEHRNNKIKANTIAYRYALNTASSPNFISSFGCNYAKGLSDENKYEGWKPKNARDIFGGNQLQIDNGILTSYGTAPPTTGTYVVGDRVVHNPPQVGQPKGWVCTVTGTPGTWVSEGNL